MKAELWSNGETMGEGVRGEGSAVTVFFSLSLAPNHPTPRPPNPTSSVFSVEFGARVSLKHTKKNRQLRTLFTFLIVLTNIGSTIFCRRKQLTENF